MGRPRRDEVRVPVRRRLAETFWSELSKSRFADIRVTELAKQTGINHNMIYYYYDGIDEMATESLHDELSDGSLQHALLLLAAGERNDETAQLLAPVRQRRKEGSPLTLAEKRHVASLYARRDAASLREALRGELMDGWLSEIGLSLEQLSDGERTGLSFLVGGVLEVLAESEEIQSTDLLEELLEGPFGNAMRISLERLFARTDRTPRPIAVEFESEEPRTSGGHRNETAKKEGGQPDGKKQAASGEKSPEKEKEKTKTIRTKTSKTTAKTGSKKQASAELEAADETRAKREKEQKAAEEAARKAAEEEAARKAAEEEAARLAAEEEAARLAAEEEEESGAMEVWML